MKQQQQSMTTILLGWFLCLHLVIFTATDADLNSDRKALLSLRAALGGRLRLWNLSSSPCSSWVGVVCDGTKSNNVMELHFPGMGLRGQLPIGSVGNLTHLQIISLRFNSIVGPIPSDLTNLASLQTLQLEGNSLSGSIPDLLFSMKNLTNLSLASNKLTGEISLSFNNLTKLVALDLEKNKLTGSIPDLNLQLDQFNVSYNRLSGEIPSRLSGMPESTFEGNSLCGKPLKPCNATDSSDGGGSNSGGVGGNKLKRGAVAGIVIACVFVFILISMICYCCRKRMNSWPPDADEEGSRTAKRVEARIQAGQIKSVGDPKGWLSSSGINNNNAGVRKLVFLGPPGTQQEFDLEDLLRAPAEVLGRGAFGTSYKAELLEMGEGSVVVVKRLREVNLPWRVFEERIKEIGSLDHENLVTPKAYYYGMDHEKLLVHDHVALGSLSAILHGDKGDDGRTALSWDARCRIALGAARGIAHLHSQLGQGGGGLHGNIKSSNILLTETYEARVSDFGLHTLACPANVPSRFQGYVAPEEATVVLSDNQKVTVTWSQRASDTYSYGVLLLELLTGKDPNSAVSNEDEDEDEEGEGEGEGEGDDVGKGIPKWVKSIVREEGISSVFDPQLLRYQNVEEDMVRLLKLALDCTNQDPRTRPSMAEVVERINKAIICSELISYGFLIICNLSHACCTALHIYF